MSAVEVVGGVERAGLLAKGNAEVGVDLDHTIVIGRRIMVTLHNDFRSSDRQQDTDVRRREFQRPATCGERFADIA